LIEGNDTSLGQQQEAFKRQIITPIATMTGEKCQEMRKALNLLAQPFCHVLLHVKRANKKNQLNLVGFA
jgi:hypothetical protein